MDAEAVRSPEAESTSDVAPTVDASGMRRTTETDTGITVAGEVIGGPNDRLICRVAHDLDADAKRATVRRPRAQRHGDAA